LPFHEEQKGKDGRQGKSAIQDLRGLQPPFHLAKKMGTQLGRGYDLQQELQFETQGHGQATMR